LPAGGWVKTDFYLYYPDSAIVNRAAWMPAAWFLAGLLVLWGMLIWPTLRRQKLVRWRAHVAAVLVGGIALGLPAAQTVGADLDLVRTDSRETARVWIHDHLPAGTRIAVESYAPYVDPMRFWVVGVSRMIEHDPEWYLEHEFEYLVFSQRMYARFYRDPEMYGVQIAQYERLFERFERLQTLTDGGYEVQIYRTGR
jgi:hypothetical protein